MGITVEQAARDLALLIERARQGEAIVIEQDGQPVARITPTSNSAPTQRIYRRAGAAKGTIWMSEDFDAPLDDMRDYEE